MIEKLDLKLLLPASMTRSERIETIELFERMKKYFKGVLSYESKRND